MNHERKWLEADRKAMARTRDLFGIHGVKVVEYRSYKDLSYEGVITQLSLNILTHLIVHKKDPVVSKDIDQLCNSVSCDMVTLMR